MEGSVAKSQAEDNLSNNTVGPSAAYLAHLPHPYHARSLQHNIPYCSTSGYDYGSFLSYPTRAGWPQALPGEDRPPFLRSEMTHPSEDKLLEDFLQTWLFFGLLCELLESRYDESRYVFRNARSVAVHTDNLKEDVGMWINDAKLLTEDEGHKSYFHLQRCLSLASTALDVISPPQHPNFNRAVRQSIILLCESVAEVVRNTLPQPMGCNIPMSWGAMFHNADSVTMMMSNNWCHSEAVLVETRMASPSSMYFTERILKPNLGRDHSTCGRNQCRYLTTNDATYHTRHVNEDCRCQHLSVSLQSLASVLDSGSVPLLRFSSEGPSAMTVTVESSDDNKAYVALSHVWADGLGNKKGTSLPSCQLSRLASLLQRLHGRLPWKSNQPETRELLFWCDTLCVPVEDPANEEHTRVRNLAMQRMCQVYQQSAYVLVLDRTLEPYNIREIGMTEAGFRIMTSPWSQRLWTYQEAALPDNLLFQSADTALDIRDVWQYHLDLSKNDILSIGIAVDIVSWCGVIRQPFHAEKGRTRNLYFVMSSLSGRHVSVPADEALCLATIFDVDISQMRATQQERMIEFWIAISSTPIQIPASLVFNIFPRLHTPGYRWAPSTFLHDPAVAQFLFVRHKEETSHQGRLGNSGLLVDLAAFSVRRARCAVHAVLDPAQQRLDAADMGQLRDLDGFWYNVQASVVHSGTNLQSVFEPTMVENNELVVLVKDQLGVHGDSIYQQVGLLTESTKDASGAQVQKSLAVLTLLSMHESEQAIWNVAYNLATYLGDSGLLPEAQSQDQAQTNTVEGLLDIIMRCASVLPDHDPGFLQLMTNVTQSHPQRLLAAVTLRIMLGQYLNMSEKFDTHRTWCVD